MLTLKFSRQSDSAYRVLCLGAHCDDIEIGCGGTILKLLEESSQAIVSWVVFSSDQQRAHEAQESAESFLKGAKSREVVIRDFRNSFFPYVGGRIKEYFEQLKETVSPDVIFTHYRGDLHQDHRLISELTWNTFRNHLILEYEVPKYDGDLGSPNLFVHLDESTSRRKVQYVVGSFTSQQEKPWFSEETFLSIMRLRGVESNAPHKYAEAFYCRKAVLGIGQDVA